MRPIKRLLYPALTVAPLFTSPTLASDAATGTIYDILTHDSGNIFFNQTGSRTARPACATEDRWVFDAKTPTGQAMLAVLLTAHANERTLLFKGLVNVTTRQILKLFPASRFGKPDQYTPINQCFSQ